MTVPDLFCPACGEHDTDELYRAVHFNAWNCAVCGYWWGNVPKTLPPCPTHKDACGVEVNVEKDHDDYLYYCTYCDEPFGLALGTSAGPKQRTMSQGPGFPPTTL